MIRSLLLYVFYGLKGLPNFFTKQMSNFFKILISISYGFFVKRSICIGIHEDVYCTVVFFVARANWGAKGSIGKDSSDCSVFQSRFRASNTHLIESLFGIIMREFIYVVPKTGLSCREEPICFIMLYFSSSLRRVFNLSR